MSRLFISTDTELLDFPWLYKTLAAEYWGFDYTPEIVRRNALAALPFGVYVRHDALGTYDGDNFAEEKPSWIEQVAFARVITDRVSFSFVCDVVVEPRHRKSGIGTLLMQAVVGHPDVKGTISLLGTKDAWRFYEKFGYRACEQPTMQRDPLK